MNPLYRMIIYPIELILEFFFSFFFKSFENYGIAIVGVSFVVSILTLPLYHASESLQRKERAQRDALASGIERIKRAFKGDEQYMMLTTYYRQNHYHPLYALRSSLSLIIQVPFFIAAYHFLSTMEQLRHASFSFIPNLGAPDGLLVVGGVHLNLLPIAMTLINIVAGIIYLKGFALREKVQLYGMAGIFLLLLYNSPSALVLYWTLNNVFSLVKNIFYKLKRPLPVLYGLSVFGVVGLSVAVYLFHPLIALSDRLILATGCAVVILIPFFIKGVKMLDTTMLSKFSDDPRSRTLLLIVSLVLLFLVHGLLIPANLISSSTIEFSYTGIVANPLTYIGNNVLFFFGLWILWPLFIYVLAKGVVKNLLVLIFPILAITAVVNLFVFTGDYGVVSTLLQLDNPLLLEVSRAIALLPLVAAFVIVTLVLLTIAKGKGRHLITFLTVLAIGTAISGGYQGIKINAEFKEYDHNLAQTDDFFIQGNTITPAFQLSKTGTNVLFIFLDRAMNSFFPYILEEIPELQEQLEGFVQYPNTVSFGQSTVFGAPAMVGGYEYTPDAMNRRTNEKLVDKHNESLLVMPKLFLDAGFSVAVTDPPYSNYKWDADFTPFFSYPEIKVMNHYKKFTLAYINEHKDVLDWDSAMESTIIQKRLPVFSILKTSFPIFRRTLYEKGNYFQQAESPLVTNLFLNPYSQLYYLSDLTEIVEEGDSFIMICNDATHMPSILQTPEFEPRSHVTNTSTLLDGIDVIQSDDRSHYHINGASLKRLGIYFDYLREQGVYDNTRIIIVADHGNALYSDGMSTFGNDREYNSFVPLFLVKDFNATGPVRTDDTFMTNADAPLFAIKDVIEEPINPFTQKNLFEEVKKDKVNVYSGPWDPRSHTGSALTYYPEHSFSVHGDIFLESNWGAVDEELW